MRPTHKLVVTVAQAAEYLAMSEAAIRQMVHRREIPFIKVGTRLRFDLYAIDLWIDRQSIPAQW